MAANEERKRLIDSIRSLLIPAFESQGFEVVPLDKDDSRSSEICIGFPFGRLRRATSLGLDLVEIQLDKNKRPLFRLNLGNVPSQGVDHAAGHVALQDVWIHYLRKYYTVYQSPFFQKWFGIRRWPKKTLTESDYKQLAKTVVEIIPEIDLALREGKCGRHIRLVH